LFAGAGRGVSLRARVPGVDTETVRPIFAGIWRESGSTYSVVLAQTAALSQKYRRLFLSEVAKLVDSSLGEQLEAAERKAAEGGRELRVPGNRIIHTFLRSPDFVVVGFEDEKAASLQGKQTLRFDEYLRARNPQPLLAFLSRGLYKPADEQAKKLRRFVPVDDGRLVGWADECLVDWLGNAERQLGQASETLSRYFTDSPASSAPQIAAYESIAH
jgi:hypothetical protein